MYWSWLVELASQDRNSGMNSPSVSIITPFLNAERFIRQIEHADGLPGTCSVLLRRAIVDVVGGFGRSGLDDGTLIAALDHELAPYAAIAI